MILVVGSINADIVIEIDRLPQLGETIQARKNRTGIFSPGGKGANQAACIGQLMDQSKDHVEFVGHFGQDHYAETLKHALRTKNVGLAHSSTLRGCPSGQAYVMVDAAGQNAIILVAGANTCQWEQDETLEKLGLLLRSSEAVLLQREIPDEVNLRVARLAKAANVPVFLDMGGHDTPFDPAWYENLFCVCPNETELARLLDLPTTSSSTGIHTRAQAIEAAQKVLSNHLTLERMLVTLGSAGAIFVSKIQDTDDFRVFEQDCCFEPREIVDTTGAGDCFRGAFVYALMYLHHMDVPHALRFATAASSLSIQSIGALPSMPTLAQVQHVLEKSHQHGHVR